MSKLINVNQFSSLVERHEKFVQDPYGASSLALSLNDVVVTAIEGNSVLYNSKSINVVYKDCNFGLCDFSNAKFIGCEFVNCTFIGCNFNGTSFARTTFKETIFENCRFQGVLLETFLKNEKNGNAIHIVNGRTEYVLSSFSKIVITREGSMSLDKFQDLALFGDNVELKRAYRRFSKIHDRFIEAGRYEQICNYADEVERLEACNKESNRVINLLIGEKDDLYEELRECSERLAILERDHEASLKLGKDLFVENFNLRIKAEASKKELAE